MPTQGLKEYRWDDDSKILSFPDDTTIFLLRDINWHTRIQSILKSYEKASSSKTNFPKIQVLWTGPYKNRIDKRDKWYGHNCTLKYLGQQEVTTTGT